MSDVMMQLGSFQFGLATAAYQEFTRSTAYTWAALARFGKDDALQSTGPGADTITLPGVVFPEFRGGTGQVDAMRALAAAAEPQALIDGRGRMLGQWVIEGIDERGSIFAQRGIARRQEFTLRLRRYPDDGPSALGGLVAGLASSVAGFSLGASSSILNSATAVAVTASKGPEGLLSSMGGALSSVTGVASSIGAQASSALGAVRGGINAARRLQNAGTDALQSLRGLNSVANIPSAMNSLVRLGGSVSQTAGVSSSILKAAGVDMTGNRANPAAVAAVRDAMIQVNQLNVLAVNVRTSAQSIIDRIGA